MAKKKGSDDTKWDPKYFENIHSAELFKCIKCGYIPKKSFNCENGHSFCFECINNIITNKHLCPKSNQLILKANEAISVSQIIGNLRMFCPNNPINKLPHNNDELKSDLKNNNIETPATEGFVEPTQQKRTKNMDPSMCDWIGKVNELDSHLEVCKLKLQYCHFKSLGCKYIGRGQQMTEHLKEDRIKHDKLLIEGIIFKDNMIQYLTDEVKMLKDQLKKQV